MGRRGVGGRGYRRCVAPALTASSSTEFAAIIEPMRRELLAHCYRMTGSSHDAEDLLQETYLRAWRALPQFESRSSVRTWLHRIATNACLNHLEGRSRRPVPVGLAAPDVDSSAGTAPGGARLGGEGAAERLVWGAPPADPGEVAAHRAQVRDALASALAHLTASQRAVLLLRDVLMWSAAEVADELGLSVAAVNSALQRARARVGEHAPGPSRGSPAGARRAQLDLFVAAFEACDVEAIVALLTADVVGAQAPYRGWERAAG